MKKIICLIAFMLMVITGCSITDDTEPTTYYAIIKFPDGEIVEGYTESFLKCGSYAYIVIDGVGYYTSYMNCVVIVRQKQI